MNINISTECLFLDVVDPTTHQAMQTNFHSYHANAQYSICLHCPVRHRTDGIQKQAFNALGGGPDSVYQTLNKRKANTHTNDNKNKTQKTQKTHKKTPKNKPKNQKQTKTIKLQN